MKALTSNKLQRTNVCDLSNPPMWTMKGIVSMGVETMRPHVSLSTNFVSVWDSTIIVNFSFGYPYVSVVLIICTVSGNINIRI